MDEKTFEKAIFILQETKDGNDLDNLHLKIVELAVNDDLSEAGQSEFERLFLSVKNGYVKPSFHDIEHLTIDQIGYVYWKGQIIEHYNLNWAYSSKAKEQAQELALRCAELERTGLPINVRTVIWEWPEAKL